MSAPAVPDQLNRVRQLHPSELGRDDTDPHTLAVCTCPAWTPRGLPADGSYCPAHAPRSYAAFSARHREVGA